MFQAQLESGVDELMARTGRPSVRAQLLAAIQREREAHEAALRAHAAASTSLPLHVGPQALGPRDGMIRIVR